MSSHTTVLLATYNRPEALLRLLSFWRKTGFDRPVIVLDSSGPEAWKQNEDACQQAGLAGPIEHRQFPESAHPFQKWQLASSEVATPFLILAADDDFLLPSALAQCEEFLLANDDYAACQGFHVSFLRYGPYFRVSEDSFTTSNDAATVEERLWKQFSNYGHFTYALRRTSIWKEWPAEIREASFSLRPEAAALHEMLDAMLCLVAGKVKRLPILHSIRNGRQTFEDGWRRSFVFGPDFSEAMVLFKNAVGRAFHHAGKTDLDHDLLLNECLSVYFGGVLRETGNRKLLLSKFPALNDYKRADDELTAMAEGMTFDMVEFHAAFEMVLAHPLDIDSAGSTAAPEYLSAYRCIREFNLLPPLPQPPPGSVDPASLKREKFLRQPRKSIKAAFRRMGERFGGNRIS